MTFKALAIEPDYMQESNPDGPTMISLLKNDSCENRSENRKKVQTEEEALASSATMMGPSSLFLYGIKAPMAREKYRGRVVKFFDFMGLAEGTREDRIKTFTDRGKKEPNWVFLNVLRFAGAQKETILQGCRMTL